MKNILFYVLIFLLFINCSNEDSIEFKYEYEIIPIPYSRIIVERGNQVNEIYGTLAYSYTIDTVEVRLNTFGSGVIRISAKNFLDPITSTPQNSYPHVNYLYFSDLSPIWEDNIIKQIFIGSPTFTYSESNLNLSQRPELFVDNPNIPIYTTLEIKDKPVFRKRLYYSNNEFSIGEVFLRSTFYAKVLQKKQL